jgi:K+-sensing histidine kinase KdpD
MSNSSSSRIAVGVELWSDSARSLIRTVAAFAGQFAAPWLAIVVSDSIHTLSLLTAEQQERIRENTDLVLSLGGVPFFCEGDDVAQTLIAAATANGVELLILGKPRDRGVISRMFHQEISTAVLHRAADLWLMFAAYPESHAASR